MAKKTIGYMKLVWTCPACQSRNPGDQKTCSNCGAPQPEDVQFEHPEREELITDQEEITKAKTSQADIHCGFCGTRNPYNASVCSQCGGDLKEGKQRASGQVLGAFQPGAVKAITCPTCGAPNPDTALNCQQCGAGLPSKRIPAAPAAPPKKTNWVLIFIAAVIALAICGLASWAIGKSMQRDSLTASVQSISWERAIEIEQYGPVKREDWKENIPAEAVIAQCTQKFHHTQPQPDPNAQSEEVCGTPYTIDKGSGVAEVVQDCEYRIYLDFCQYTVNEWSVIDTAVLRGNDLNPQWPQPALTQNQRPGQRQEQYLIIFSSDKNEYLYRTDNSALFSQAVIGSQWKLTIDGFGNVVTIEPVN
ncbi:MAG: zinc ribbon domain-containing protein [Anaerolineae bacterium]|nr:zinc ribbon domain-containing protein [Anaerolineae bacterium]